MTSTLLTLTLAVVIAADPPVSPGKREPNPFAPSLPQLTDQEEANLDKIIDHFIEFDLGLLRGTEAKQAKDDFDKLGPEAIFALIRGLNRAALIEGSCPALVIARKLDRFLRSSTDPELLQFAHENIGLDVKQSRHLGVIKDLRFGVSLRKSALARAGITKYNPALGYASDPAARTTIKPLSSLSDSELAAAAGSDRSPRLKRILTELGTRKSEDALNALAAAAGSLYEEDVQKTAREALLTNLSQQSPAVVQAGLKDDRIEMRVAAAAAAGTRSLTACGGDLVDLLADTEARVRDAAHQALVKLNKGGDLGPSANATDADRDAAVKKWRDWWGKQSKR
jgi:hypothetical protein